MVKTDKRRWVLRAPSLPSTAEKTVILKALVVPAQAGTPLPYRQLWKG